MRYGLPTFPWAARTLAACAAVLSLLLPGAVRAQTITSSSESRPFPGVRVVEGRTSSPGTNFYAAYISLCEDRVHVDATGSTSSLRSASSWARSAGAQLAVNGDFFGTYTGSRHLYGDAVGGGRRWPAARAGRGDEHSGNWYYMRYGWIAFGDGWVQYNYTKYIKENADKLGLEANGGWRPNTVTKAIPEGTKALVSGFSQLVIEGRPFPCSSPTASDCFPDRGDMSERHPRTAMGLTRDRKTLLLVVVDGRSGSSAGMYGAELAQLMHRLGAWNAFNLDGGGSSQMWVRGRGTINRPSAGSPRGVLNHWGVFAGSGHDRGRLPGSCDPTWDELVHHAPAFDDGATVDVDGDGRADTCGRGADGLECYLSDGEGLPTAVPGPPLADDSGWGKPEHYGTIRYGDLDGDGRADVCARAAAGMRCWLFDGEGFETRINGPEWSNDAGWNDVRYFSTIRLVDLDGDGRADLCGRDADGIVCHRSQGDGFGPALRGPDLADDSGWGRPEHYGTIRFGDVNGDGLADVCARAIAGMLCWLSYGEGFETRIDGPEWTNDAGWDNVRYWSTIRLADLDDDGRADLCGRHAGGYDCHLSGGDGFGPAVEGPELADGSGWADYSNYGTIRLADVDGDGALDVCARANAGLRCWPWRDGEFGSALAGPFGDETGWYRERFFRTIQLADIDADGRADACARASARLFCWRSLGDDFDDMLLDGPEWSDEAGWDAPRFFSTVRMVGPRVTRLEESPDPTTDGGVAGDGGAGGGGGGTPTGDASLSGDGGGGTGAGRRDAGGASGCNCRTAEGLGGEGAAALAVIAVLLGRRRRRAGARRATR